MKTFCDNHGVGIADDHYARAIRAIAENYDKWQTTVEKFVSRVHVEKNNHRLAEKIRKELEEQQA